MLVNNNKTINILEKLIANGTSIEDSIKKLYKKYGFGLMTICIAVEKVANITSREAKILTIKATRSFTD